MRLSLPLAVLLTLLIAAPASASTKQFTLFEAPGALVDEGQRDATLDEVAALGADGVRILVNWNRVAPDPTSSRKPTFDATDPAAYGNGWARYDAAVEAARERGLRVLLTITGGAPFWATSTGKDALTRPDPDMFEAFVFAAGKRYADRVGLWSIWNEPNQPQFLLPQFAGGKPQSPKIYRRLYIAGKRALMKSGNSKDRVLAAETSPRGNPRIVAPLAFLRGFLCLDSKYRKSKSCGKIDAEGWAHHPYSTRQGPYFVSDNKDDVTIGTLSRLTRALDKAAKAGAIRRGMPMYLTEFGIQSEPDDLSGVPLSTQADYRSISEFIAYGNGRVAGFSQYLMRDSDPFPFPGATKYSGFESGLRSHSGKEKPAYEGFRLPLVAHRYAKDRIRLWGYVRPAKSRTKVEITYANHGGRKWRKLTTLTTNSRGYFSTRRKTSDPRRRYRVSWVAPDGKEFQGPVTKSRSLSR